MVQDQFPSLRRLLLVATAGVAIGFATLFATNGPAGPAATAYRADVTPQTTIAVQHDSIDTSGLIKYKPDNAGDKSPGPPGTVEPNRAITWN